MTNVRQTSMYVPCSGNTTLTCVLMSDRDPQGKLPAETAEFDPELWNAFTVARESLVYRYSSVWRRRPKWPRLSRDALEPATGMHASIIEACPEWQVSIESMQLPPRDATIAPGQRARQFVRYMSFGQFSRNIVDYGASKASRAWI